MRKATLLCSLFILVLAVPGIAQAGLNVYPADGPAPVIQIEPPKPLEYKVQKGDSVATIAKKFSIDAKTLLSANGLSDPRKLQAGKTLKIPGQTAPASQTAAKPMAAPANAPASAPPAVAPQPTAETKAGTTVAKPELASRVATEKPDAAARKASGKGELDPGVVVEAPVKGKKGKKGKQEPAGPPPPTITLDDKTRASFGKTGVITNNTDVPQAIREEFLQYAYKWVDELETIGVGTFRAKKIKQVGSQWEASYRVILRESLGAEVKRVEYEHTPYVGHITYVQRMFTSVGPTKQAALQGPYTEKDEAIREIFSYSGAKKAWR
jgi:LysM repeat protein